MSAHLHNKSRNRVRTSGLTQRNKMAQEVWSFWSWVWSWSVFKPFPNRFETNCRRTFMETPIKLKKEAETVTRKGGTPRNWVLNQQIDYSSGHPPVAIKYTVLPKFSTLKPNLDGKRKWCHGYLMPISSKFPTWLRKKHKSKLQVSAFHRLSFGKKGKGREEHQ